MDISEQTVIINPHAMLPVGTLLQNGKYRIERYLSSGGFGNTYVATNIEFEEQIAIKEFFIRGVTERDGDSVSVSVSNRDNLEQFAGQMEKFKKEARRLRKLDQWFSVIVVIHVFSFLCIIKFSPGTALFSKSRGIFRLQIPASAPKIHPDKR